jgi:hypothetical protein
MERDRINQLNRRDFIKINLSLAGLLLYQNCASKKTKSIPLKFHDSFGSRGHQLWENEKTIIPELKIEKDIVVIGGGISGLSTAYHLNKKNRTDFLLLELSNIVGGNSINGENEYSKYPYGAHYLTIPNNENKPLLDFLSEKRIITGFDENQFPIYNETDLCFDPEERLYIKGGFQDGLVPNYGISDADKKEISSFFKMLEDFKLMKGPEGSYYFNTPYSLCSTDPKLDYLDEISFEEFLNKNNFKCGPLKWYLNYCCMDDFGGDTSQISAWSGINYFACHHAQPSNTDPSRVLTWPEGNGRLVNLLKETIKPEQFANNCLVKKIELKNSKVEITYFDFTKNKHGLITCNYCVVATPPFVTSKLLDKNLDYPFDKTDLLKHMPWGVASLTLNKLPESRGEEMCWDNVFYQKKSLGYIYNQHQTLGKKQDKFVITIYFNFNDPDTKKMRKLIRSYTEEDWRNLILEELESVHNGITETIEEIDLKVWGHGMILPAKGLIKSGVLKAFAKPINDQLFFAHSDLAGYSTFEEAFDLGFRAVNKITGNS